MREFKELLEYRKALSIILDDMRRIKRKTEIISIEEALGRVLADDVESPIDSPPFNRSAVDGYALRARDTFQAREYRPVELKVVCEVTAGEECKTEVREGTAVYLTTGTKLPHGVDAVLMQEMAEREGDRIRVLRPVAPGQNVSLRGEDVRKGEVILRRGTILRPQDVALLKSVGIKRVSVVKKPKVCIVVTGSELVEEADPSELERGKIMESNSIMLRGLVERYLGEPVIYGVIPDDEEEVKKAVEWGKSNCDLTLVTGGSAFGKRDLAHFFVRLKFHGTTIKPGRPMGYGERVFIMSGYPVAVFAQFQLFVKHAIAELVGAKDYEVKVRARLTERIASQLGRYEFVKVLYRNGEATPVKRRGSGLISTLVESNGYMEIPENSEGFLEGEEVAVTLY